MDERVVAGDRFEVEPATQVEERLAKLGVFTPSRAATERGHFRDVIIRQSPAQDGPSEISCRAGDRETKPSRHTAAKAHESSLVSSSAHQRTSASLSSEVMQTRRMGLPKGHRRVDRRSDEDPSVPEFVPAQQGSHFIE